MPAARFAPFSLPTPWDPGTRRLGLIAAVRPEVGQVVAAASTIDQRGFLAVRESGGGIVPDDQVEGSPVWARALKGMLIYGFLLAVVVGIPIFLATWSAAAGVAAVVAAIALGAWLGIKLMAGLPPRYGTNLIVGSEGAQFARDDDGSSQVLAARYDDADAPWFYSLVGIAVGGTVSQSIEVLQVRCPNGKNGPPVHGDRWQTTELIRSAMTRRASTIVSRARQRLRGGGTVVFHVDREGRFEPVTLTPDEIRPPGARALPLPATRASIRDGTFELVCGADRWSVRAADLGDAAALLELVNER